jgi:cytochrome c oxidase subunit 4
MSQHGHAHGHIESAKNYVLVFLGLIVLTVLTTAVAFVDLGMFNVAVALGIATGKMLLVALFFMHVKHSSALTKLILVGALLWLAIMIGFTMADFNTRGWFGVLGR